MFLRTGIHSAWTQAKVNTQQRRWFWLVVVKLRIQVCTTTFLEITRLNPWSPEASWRRTSIIDVCRVYFIYCEITGRSLGSKKGFMWWPRPPTVCDIVLVVKLYVRFSWNSMEEFVTKFSNKFREIRLSTSHALLQGLNEVLSLLSIFIDRCAWNSM